MPLRAHYELYRPLDAAKSHNAALLERQLRSLRDSVARRGDRHPRTAPGDPEAVQARVMRSRIPVQSPLGYVAGQIANPVGAGELRKAPDRRRIIIAVVGAVEIAPEYAPRIRRFISPRVAPFRQRVGPGLRLIAVQVQTSAQGLFPFGLGR